MQSFRREYLSFVLTPFLQEPSCDPTAAENYGLCWAARNGFADIVQLLLADKRVNPAACDNYPVRLAAEFGHLVNLFDTSNP